MDKKIKKVEVKEEMVEVSKVDMNAVLQKLEDNKKDIAMLLDAADKGRIAKYNAMHGGDKPLIRKVKVSRWGKNGEIITSWKMLINESYVDSKGYHEKQIVEIKLENGESKQVDLVDFYRTVSKETSGEIIGSKNEGGKEYAIIELEDGKKIELELRVLN